MAFRKAETNAKTFAALDGQERVTADDLIKTLAWYADAGDLTPNVVNGLIDVSESKRWRRWFDLKRMKWHADRGVRRNMRYQGKTASHFQEVSEHIHGLLHKKRRG